MKRKKKNEQLTAIDSTPFNPDTMLPELTIDTDIIETTTLFDRTQHTIIGPTYRVATSDGGHGGSFHHHFPSIVLGSDALHAFELENLREKLEKETVGNVNIVNKKSMIKGEHIVMCNDMMDLSQERILKTLSAIKGKLMLDISPFKIKYIECSMTPIIRRNIIQASKRLKMYGKKPPVIACYDDYGNRLPDKMELDETSHGITLNIIESERHGEFYLEMKAVELPLYETDLEDFPF